MSDSSSEASTDVRLDSDIEETAEVLSEESGGVITETRPVEKEEDELETTTVLTEEAPEDSKERSGWVPLAIGVFAVVAIAAIAIILLLRTGSPQVQLGEAGERGVQDQADWKFTVTRTVGGKHPGGKHPPPPKKEVQAIQELVRNWNDALILSPGQFSQVTKKYFAPPAGNAISSSDFGLPKSASEVDTTRREARIAIQADGAARAVVDVKIVSRGKSDEGEFRTESLSTLWLERTGSKWTVIAFEADQRPLPLNPKEPPQNEGPTEKPDDGGKKPGPQGQEPKKNDKKGGQK